MKVEDVVFKLFPDEGIRVNSLSAFTDAINQANALGRNKWGAHHLNDRLRLVMGNLIVFTLHTGRIWLALDKALLEESDEKRQFLEGARSFQWDTDGYPMYKAVPSRNAYYTPNTNHSELWPVIKEFHFAYLVKVAHKYKKLRAQSQRTHSPALLEYLETELRRFIPVPVHGYRPENDDVLIPEEIPEKSIYHEGSKQRLTVNAYERNLKARQKCIEHYGTTCAVCGLNLGMVYGEVGNGFIHIHHLKRLSDIGEKYEVDPIRDLRPVCPNCHAIIHRRAEPYSIEEVKHFIGVAGFCSDGVDKR